MRRILTVLIFGLLWNAAAAQTAAAGRDELAGPVKEVRHETSDSAPVGGAARRGRSASYDLKGNKVEETLYSADGSVAQRVVYNFDAQGRATGFEEYSYGLSTPRRHVYVLGEKGERVEYKIVQPDGKAGEKRLYKLRRAGPAGGGASTRTQGPTPQPQRPRLRRGGPAPLTNEVRRGRLRLLRRAGRLRRAGPSRRALAARGRHPHLPHPLSLRLAREGGRTGDRRVGVGRGRAAHGGSHARPHQLRLQKREAADGGDPLRNQRHGPRANCFSVRRARQLDQQDILLPHSGRRSTGRVPHHHLLLRVASQESPTAASPPGFRIVRLPFSSRAGPTTRLDERRGA